jgi:hypothetical protein
MSESKTSAGDSRTVHLVSQEGESFDVPLNVAKMSELVKTMIDEEQDEEEAQEIPLPNVKSSVLAKIIEFTQHYKTDPMNEIEKVRPYLVFVTVFKLVLISFVLFSAFEVSKYVRDCPRVVFELHFSRAGSSF